MLSRVDLLRSLVMVSPEAEALSPAHGTTVGEVMSPHVPTVAEGAPLTEIIEHMVTGNVRRVIVLDQSGKPIGLITDGDLVARVALPHRSSVIDALRGRGKAQAAKEVTARSIMSAGVLSGPPDTLIGSAVSQMLARPTKRFVVVDAAGKPIGIVDRQTLLRALL
jgi:predicted transcriptional regulator